LLRVSTGRVDTPSEPAKPAVSVKKSMTPDYLVCLEDGKRFKSLKRHLRTQYNMTPEQYRDKWGLPPDYPMVAPNYAVARSALAKKMGLGQQRRRRK
jgi:predicted transcriptional regulator